MRILIAAASLFAATPALAQDDGARVDNVSETSDGYTCRAHELPELRLSHDWRDSDRSATWEGTAREAGGADLRLRVSILPDLDSPSGIAARVPGFELNMLRAPLRAPAASAHLRLDGIPYATPLTVEGNTRALSVIVVERQREELAAKLMTVSIVELDLVDAAGTPLGRMSWDVRKLRRSGDVLRIINWSCR